MALGGRSISTVLGAPLRWRHYRGLAAAPKRYLSPWSDLRRYVTGGGTYPYRCRIRTPAGVVAPTLYSRHDMLTVHEIFCRRIYPVDPGSRVIVDVGANIGISALYFLTEAPGARCHLFEANPALIERLRDNVRPFSERVAIEDVALDTFDGTVAFGVEVRRRGPRGDPRGRGGDRPAEAGHRGDRDRPAALASGPRPGAGSGRASRDRLAGQSASGPLQDAARGGGQLAVSRRRSAGPGGGRVTGEGRGRTLLSFLKGIR
jgi:hypothetical protein